MSNHRPIYRRYEEATVPGGVYSSRYALLNWLERQPDGSWWAGLPVGTRVRVRGDGKETLVQKMVRKGHRGGWRLVAPHEIGVAERRVRSSGSGVDAPDTEEVGTTEEVLAKAKLAGLIR